MAYDERLFKRQPKYRGTTIGWYRIRQAYRVMHNYIPQTMIAIGVISFVLFIGYVVVKEVQIELELQEEMFNIQNEDIEKIIGTQDLNPIEPEPEINPIINKIGTTILIIAIIFIIGFLIVTLILHLIDSSRRRRRDRQLYGITRLY